MGVRVGPTVLNVTDLERTAAFWTQGPGYVVMADPNGNEFCVIEKP